MPSEKAGSWMAFLRKFSMDLSNAARWGMHWTPKARGWTHIGVRPPRWRLQHPPCGVPNARVSPTTARGRGSGGAGAGHGGGSVCRWRRILSGFARRTGAALHGHVRHCGGDRDIRGMTNDIEGGWWGVTLLFLPFSSPSMSVSISSPSGRAAAGGRCTLGLMTKGHSRRHRSTSCWGGGEGDPQHPEKVLSTPKLGV